MCCCSCAGCGQATGSVLYVVEKLASFTALTAVVMCVMVTLGITLGLGIGIGYNYCYIDYKVIKVDPDSDGTNGNQSPTSTEPPSLRSRKVDRQQIQLGVQPDKNDYRRNEKTVTPSSSRRTMALPGIKHTMAMPLHGDFDFPSLLAKLRGRNRNVTLELIT